MIRTALCSFPHFVAGLRLRYHNYPSYLISSRFFASVWIKTQRHRVLVSRNPITVIVNVTLTMMRWFSPKSGSYPRGGSVLNDFHFVCVVCACFTSFVPFRDPIKIHPPGSDKATMTVSGWHKHLMLIIQWSAGESRKIHTHNQHAIKVPEN